MLIAIEEYIESLGVPQDEHILWFQLFLKDIVTGKMSGQLVDGQWMVNVIEPWTEFEKKMNEEFEEMLLDNEALAPNNPLDNIIGLDHEQEDTLDDILFFDDEG